MIEPGLTDALNDSINRLARGASVSNCLRRYPQHAAELEHLLEMGQLVRRSQSSLEEARQARERGQFQFDRALMEPMPRRVPFQRLAQLVATLVLVFAVFASGAGLLAENSLPGDALYNVKLLTENARLSLISNPDLQATFDQRRIDEARQIVELRREVELTFTGTVDSVQDSQLQIEGLTVNTSALSQRDPFVPGQRVAVWAVSDAQGNLTAREIRPLEPPPQTDKVPPTTAPTNTDVPSRQPTRETQRPTQTPPERDGSPSPTVTDRAVDITPSQEASGCTVSPPEGWVAYTIQAGDTLSTLAARSGGSLDEVAAVNCLTDTRIIVVGQRIYLPAQPAMTRPAITDAPVRPTATAQPTQERDQGGQRDSDSPQRREPTQEPQRDGENSDGGRRR